MMDKPLEATGEPVEALAPKDEGISIRTLKKKEKEKIMRAVRNGKDIAEQYYLGKLEPYLLRQEKIYNADKNYYREKFPKLSEKCEWRSLGVKTAVDGITPSLMEVFTGADDPVDVVGRHVDDDAKAKKVSQLLKYDLYTKNDYITCNFNVLRDSMKLNFGVAKVWWNREEDRKHYQIMIAANDYAKMAYIADAVAMGTMDVTSITEVEGGYYNVEYDEVRILANHPVIEALPPSDAGGKRDDCGKD